MMDSAYFVGRGELLTFFNELLDLQLAKIEQTASGAIACQLTEYIFPGSIPMARVNWEAKYVFLSFLFDILNSRPPLFILSFLLLCSGRTTSLSIITSFCRLHLTKTK